MARIGGNTIAEIQVKTIKRNSIGEAEESWKTIQTVLGFLDFSSGESRYGEYNAKIEESDHVFIADYVSLDKAITPKTSRMVIRGIVYDVSLIDNPMGLNWQLEFYLKAVGVLYG